MTRRSAASASFERKTMSKLSRYKKPPAVKLPLPPKKNIKKSAPSPVLESNSDDEDFVTIKSKGHVPSVKNPNKDKQDEESPLVTRASSSKNPPSSTQENNYTNNKAPPPPSGLPPPTTSSRTRKKKDPELDLAIALSESLHREVERIKENENEFIVSNNLQREIELRPLMKIPDEIKPVHLPPVKQIKRRKKVNLSELPLYKASEQDKKLDIERRLDKILDEHEDKDAKRLGEFYIRDNLPITSIRLPHRLKDCLNAASTNLWCMSKSEISTRDAPMLYVIKSVSECKLNEDAVRQSIIKSGSLEDDLKTNESSKPAKILVIGGTEKISDNPSISKSSPKNRTCKEFPKKVSADLPIKVDEGTVTHQQLIKDLLQMFVNPDGADVTVYGREEKPIRCHKFILMARSRKLYSEIVQETSRKGVEKDVIALTCFSHIAVKAFIKFLYCGKLKGLQGQDLDDVLELGSRYDVVIIPSHSDHATTSTSSNPTFEPSKKSMESEVQLERPGLLPHSSSPPEPKENLELCQPLSIHLKESSNRNRSAHSRRNSLQDIFADECVNEEADYKASNDIFEEEEEKNLVNKCSPNHAYIVHDEGSRDMFEDLDDEDSEENHPSGLTVLNISTVKKSEESDHESEDSNDRINMEEELMTQIDSHPRRLFSPKPESPTHRANHDMFPSSQTSLTASQVASYIDYMGNLTQSRHEPGKSQANKKHKLQVDNCSILDSVDCNNDDSLTLVSEGGEIVRSFKKLRKDSKLCVHSTPLSASSTIPYTQSSYTPPLSNSYKPCLSPVQRMEVDVEDPFEDPFGTGGDSCFLNLPSIICQNSSSLIQPRNALNTLSVNPYIPRPSGFSSSPVSSRNQSQDPEFSDTQNKRKRQTASKEGKGGKNNKKQGQGRRRASSQEPTPTRNMGDQQKISNPSHAMDYSTIDTPILKKELKRYGLKPLPRSKAKLILRHIDEETSKR